MAAEPVIVEAVRTPIGKRGGALANLHPAYLLGETYRELLARTGIQPTASSRSSAARSPTPASSP